jgi:uncharacterized membrane protein
VDADRERNDREWNDPVNWKGPFYVAPGDTRPFVPKRGRRRGYTVNFANPLGRTFVLAVVALVLATACIAFLVERRSV